jgi:hypothetical protein
MKVKTTLISIAVLLVSYSAAAAKPASISFKENITNSEGASYQVYTVKCTDGTSRDIAAWDNRNLWCVGDIIKEDDCNKKQIKVARKVCKST